MTIRSTIILAGLSFMVLLMIAGWLGAMQYRDLIDHERALLEREAHYLEVLHASQVAFERQTEQWKNVLLRGHDETTYREHLSQFYVQERKVLETLSALKDALSKETDYLDSRTIEAVERFLAAHTDAGRQYRAALRVFNASDSDAPAVAERTVRQVNERPRKYFDEIDDGLRAHRQRTSDELTHLIRDTELRLIMFAVVLLAGFFISFTWVLNQRIALPIQSAIRSARRIAEQDLDTPLQTERHDEIGKLVDALEHMRSTLLKSNTALVLARDEAQRARNVLDDRVKERTRELEESEARFRDFVAYSNTGIAVRDSDGRYLIVNDRYRELLDLTGVSLIGKTPADVLPPNLANQIDEFDDKVLSGEPPTEREVVLRGNSEHERVILGTQFAIKGPDGTPVSVGAMVQDITQRKQDEAKSRLLEDSLRQAQKMEAVGQLTGGIAHDFNNLLAVIMGNIEILSEQAKDQDDVADFAERAFTAAERGAELTHRLLAFSRKQPLQPALIDVNQLVMDMQELLVRTLGEDIEIRFIHGAGLWHCEADPGQLENAVLNLCINARDAMPDGGMLTIETANTSFDNEYSAAQEDVTPGDYVMIAISDTGTGMNTATIAKAFEPFFTTKDVGKGSGLGLSMIYGFTQQSGGHARIYSEPGEGTTVKLYLPRSTQIVHARQHDHDDTATDISGHGETVLVVEDDAGVRSVAVKILTDLGYNVLEAPDARKALELIDGAETVDLLLTDVILPGGMGGRGLAEQACARLPGLQVLYMSGYTENAIMHHGRLDPGVQLLVKPFRRATLASKVREILDSPA